MQRAIMNQVRETPGIHLRGLQQELECTTTTLTYHLSNLPIRSRHIRNYRRLYPESIPQNHERPLAALNHSQRGPMLHYISQDHTLARIAELLGLTRQTISSHLTILTDDQLVQTRKIGRTKELQLQQDTVATLKRYGQTILDHHVDNFIAMWD